MAWKHRSCLSTFVPIKCKLSLTTYFLLSMTPSPPTSRCLSLLSWRGSIWVLFALQLAMADFVQAATSIFWPEATDGQWAAFTQSWDLSRDEAPIRIGSAKHADIHIMACNAQHTSENAKPLERPPTIWFNVKRTLTRAPGAKDVWVWDSPSPELMLASFKDVLAKYQSPGVLFGPNNQTQFQRWQTPLVEQLPMAQTRFFRSSEKPSRVIQGLFARIDSIILLKSNQLDPSEAMVILQEATRHRLPVFTDNAEWIPYGAAVAIDYPDHVIGAQYAKLAQQILHNPKLAPQEPAFSFVINQQIIRSLDLTVHQPTTAQD